MSKEMAEMSFIAQRDKALAGWERCSENADKLAKALQMKDETIAILNTRYARLKQAALSSIHDPYTNDASRRRLAGALEENGETV